VGQGTIREQVVGLANRKATSEEIEKMKALAAQGMRDGAFGLSTGLYYVPGKSRTPCGRSMRSIVVDCLPL